MAAFMHFLERGLDESSAAKAVVALHPFADDGPIPSRKYEKAVRKRSRRFAKSARGAPLAEVNRMAREALKYYAGTADTYGEGAYAQYFNEVLNRE